MEEEIKRTKELNDKYEHIYNEKYASKNWHNEPSPETLKMLGEQDKLIGILQTKQDTFMDKLEQSIQDNKEAHSEIIKEAEIKHKSLVEMMLKIEDKLDNALEKKAGIWTEKVLIGFGVIVATGLLGWLGSLIIETFKHIQ